MRRLLAALLVLAALALPALGGAEGTPPAYKEAVYLTQPGDAEDITAECKITVASKGFTLPRLTDRDWDSYWKGEPGGKTVEITCPKPAYGLYICWLEEPRAWKLSQQVHGRWQETVFEPSGMMHEYIPLDGATKLRLAPQARKPDWFGMSELFILGEGNVPRYVQRWQMPDDSCDLMIYVAHPDDETLFFGGAIPYYAGELKKDLVVAVFTPGHRLRKAELLNAMWLMGAANYPVFGPFHDTYSLKLDTAYSQFGKSKVLNFTTALFRQYGPRVVLTHDANGEYGHGMHRICADASLKAFDYAADPARHPESAQQYGAFQAEKLYLHLYEKNQIEMDWDVPLSAFGGLTGFQMAQAGYGEHQSQHRYEQYQVEPKESDKSSYLFGLARTTVGLDIKGNDFLENTKGAIAK
ncbi:MAG: PIG-L family deacetylase [Eubacteriales bacterium]|nr:PIG-L family deacetylase [Eubacteriales bacterium]